jgi:hypothetical protein
MIVRQIFGLVGRDLSADAKDVEIAVLRHQRVVLRRQIARPRYAPTDRMILAALAKLLLRDRWPIFLVTPSTLPRRNRQMSRARAAARIELLESPTTTEQTSAISGTWTTIITPTFALATAS